MIHVLAVSSSGGAIPSNGRVGTFAPPLSLTLALSLFGSLWLSLSPSVYYAHPLYLSYYLSHFLPFGLYFPPPFSISLNQPLYLPCPLTSFFPFISKPYLILPQDYDNSIS